MVLNYLLRRIARLHNLKWLNAEHVIGPLFGGEVKIARICWLYNLTDWLLDMLLVLFGGGIKLYNLLAAQLKVIEY